MIKFLLDQSVTDQQKKNIIAYGEHLEQMWPCKVIFTSVVRGVTGKMVVMFELVMAKEIQLSLPTGMLIVKEGLVNYHNYNDNTIESKGKLLTVALNLDTLLDEVRRLL